MPDVSRRRILRLAGVASTGGFTGCSALSDDGSEPQEIAFIRAVNDTPQPRTIQFIVLEDDELVYGVSPTVPAAVDGVGQSYEFEGLPTEPGLYDIYARLGGSEDGPWQQFPAGTFPERCLRIRIDIEADPDAAGPELGVTYGVDPNICESSPTSG
jgi:hypothetical protein